MPLIAGELRDVEVTVLPCFARCVPQAFADLARLLYLQLSHTALMQHRSHHSCVPEGSPVQIETLSAYLSGVFPSLMFPLDTQML